MTSSERLSGTTSEKRGVPQPYWGGENSGNVWKPQMPWIIGLGAPSRTLEGNFRKRSESVSGGLSGIFPEFLPESPSRTGGMAHYCESGN